ncbi:trissin receptor isoform X4 [Drosophila elegans]|uniref:trissin receptor isoform X4 n=1 Tax=Drosophila elegans TaxID=30023 RepID=UPI001BC83E38|nr:trissin receptor isoform X4 [Drosophila elegans]
MREMMMMKPTSRVWQQESEVEQRKQHKQLKQRCRTDRANILVAYAVNSDNNDGNHGEAHNQNNDSQNSSMNLSTSAFRRRKPQQKPRDASTGPHFSASQGTMALVLLSISALTSSANVSSTTTHLSINGSGNGTDYILLLGDSTTPLAPAQTTGLSGVGSGGDIEDEEDAEKASEYIFDRTDVRIVFITLYTLVFCCCFFGNLLVILVVTLSRRLRSITNFFLANLAFADFCVGLFCVMQNLSIYLIESWVFGEFLCRMYQFVHSLSYTASIFILVVICMERYFAIVHPITCKQILTAARLRMVIVTVWITSAVYSTPKFVFSKTIKNIHTQDGQEEEICVLDREMFNSKLLDMINFVLLYVMPLLVMTKIGCLAAIKFVPFKLGKTLLLQINQAIFCLYINIHFFINLRRLTIFNRQNHQEIKLNQVSGELLRFIVDCMYVFLVLYSKIAIALWRSSRGLAPHVVQHQQPQQASCQDSGMGMHNSMYHHQHHHHHQHHQLPTAASAGSGPLAGVGMGGAGSSLASGGSSTTSLSRKQSSKYEKRGVSITESQVTFVSR